MKFHHIFSWGNFGETDSFPIISQRGNGNFRFPLISHRNWSIFLNFPSKNYGEILIFFAVGTVSMHFRKIGIRSGIYFWKTVKGRVYIFKELV